MFSFYVMKSINNPFLDPITNPIGSRLQLKGYTFEVVEEKSCNGCFFNRPQQCPSCARNYMYNDIVRRGFTWAEPQSLGRCFEGLRTDKKSAIFKRIKDEE